MSGDFLGFGTNKSHNVSQPTTTNVTTTTETNMRDVGVTGQHAVELVDTLVQGFGKAYTPLVAGAGQLTVAARENAETTITAAREDAETTITAARDTGTALLKQANLAANNVDVNEMLKIGLIGVAAVVAVMQYNKG